MNRCSVEFNHEKIRSVLGSTAIYGEEDAFLRELLSNAVDACNTRRALACSFGTEFLELEEAKALNSIRNPFDARIIITYNSQTGRLSVEDNGIGMNAWDIENYVAKIGESYYTSEAFARQKLTYEPVSETGVGMLSCFMAAKAILIESKKDRAVNTAWNMSDRQSLEPVTAKWIQNEDIEYIKSSREESGTKITLVLRTRYAGKLTLMRIVRMVSHYMLYQPFPIEIAFDGHRVVMQEKNEIMHNPYADVLGIVSIPVMSDMMEGCIWIYNSRQADLMGKSYLFQQGFLISKDYGEPAFKPAWIRHMSYHLNLKKKFLNLRLSRDGVVDDSRKTELRKVIGQLITKYFWKNPLSLEQYLSCGHKPMLTEYDSEMKLLGNAVSVDVYYEGKEVTLPITTIIQGFEGGTAKLAFMNRGMFDYYRLNHFVDFKQTDRECDIIVFEKNRDIFCQLLAPYRRVHKYVVSECKGIIYDVMIADFGTLKSAAGYCDRIALRPERIDYEEFFCIVANDTAGRLEVIINEEHKLGRMLAPVIYNPKVHRMVEIILENIKQRILEPGRAWNKIVDFGGSFVDELDAKAVPTVKSINCLESDFVESLNEYIECTLSSSERLELGLMGFQFHRADFISWWFAPRE